MNLEKIQSELSDQWSSWLKPDRGVLVFCPLASRPPMEADLRSGLAREEGFLSSSHSDGFWLAVTLFPKFQSVGGVGVDFERRSRPISSKAQAWLTKEDAGIAGLSPIELWVVKEACFKSFPHNSGTLLHNYKVKKYDPLLSQGELQVPDSRGSVEFLLTHCNAYVVAFARYISA